MKRGVTNLQNRLQRVVYDMHGGNVPRLALWEGVSALTRSYECVMQSGRKWSLIKNFQNYFMFHSLNYKMKKILNHFCSKNL